MGIVIRVRWLAPTETLPSRYVADDGHGDRLVVSRHDPRIDKVPADALPTAVAGLFCRRFNIRSNLVGGVYGDAHYFVAVKKKARGT